MAKPPHTGSEMGVFYLICWLRHYPQDRGTRPIVVLPSVIRERIPTEEGSLEVQSGEGLPRTVLEAMYLGKPVVASSIAGVPEAIVNGETGYVVPPGDPEKLAAAICYLLESPDKRRVMGEAGAMRARSLFTTEAVVQKTVVVYQELVEKR
jgi:glycosyltransferase involved in cell wall biosynthesis